MNEIAHMVIQGTGEVQDSFSKVDLDRIRSFYQSQGYVIVRNLIPSKRIGQFESAYDQLKKSKFYFFQSQDTARWEKLWVNTEGLIERSIHNPLNLLFKPAFRQAVANIVCAPEVAEVLQCLTGRENYMVWQTMFFDKSTATVAHQDYWYLDSDPPGNLVAGWFALEDIQLDSGPFFVAPGSHQGPLIQRRDRMHGEMEDQEAVLQGIQQVIQQQNYALLPMLLKKGDVLFWHPFLIHGSFANQNPFHSRKSFTAHYLPEGYRMFQVEQMPQTEPTGNPHFSKMKQPSLLTQIKAYARLTQKYYGRRGNR